MLQWLCGKSAWLEIQRSLGSRRTRGTALSLCPWARHFILSFVLVQPRKPEKSLKNCCLGYKAWTLEQNIRQSIYWFLEWLVQIISWQQFHYRNYYYNQQCFQNVGNNYQSPVKSYCFAMNFITWRRVWDTESYIAMYQNRKTIFYIFSYIM